MSLRERIAARIASQGPISVAEYMTECLLHPEFGYYTTHPSIGAEGDFVTAPEISQMFGELVGLCLAQAWIDQGSPSAVTLAELGPGRGTLMADLLRATRGVPGFAEAGDVVLVEAAPRLAAVQDETLAGHSFRRVADIAALPEDAPLFLVANEFFDALPIRQFVRAGDGWRERRVGLDQAGDLHMGLGPALPVPALDHRREDTQDGDLVETAPASEAVAEAVGRRIVARGGAALIIDYGDWRSLGDTFQALHNGASADPLAHPGAADLTAHVDFEVIARAAPCAHTRLTPQGVFLERLGITGRAQALAGRLSEDRLGAHVAAHRRLTHPDEMGNLFKVLGLYPNDAVPPPGLDP
ncbi:SAM-dependent methyltransferase [Sulfitobacter sp. D35]|uniref:class I SAM-dependent methyltransferase n=1 Tax=Sulfitobacter sp. D35 TaxID=3083252 RepID=UPI00296FBC58|nr:SAM-dependent methyltransferase [Sulfitobacter sp. D35]MDW4497086.1 SAM-dependent methyltransferase [Sulfitobacter sp. D35]